MAKTLEQIVEEYRNKWEKCREDTGKSTAITQRAYQQYIFLVDILKQTKGE